MVKNRQEWVKLVGKFEAAAKAQPGEHHRAYANLEAARLSMQCWHRFKNREDLARAERLARSVLKNCPRCEAAPEALLVLGRALAGKGSPDDAYRELMKVELSYPASASVEEAKSLMSALRAGAPGGGIPPYPTDRPLDGEAAPAKASASASASPPSAPPSPPSPKPPAGEARGRETPVRDLPGPGEVKPPVKAPPPRADGLAQVYAYSISDLGSRTLVTCYLDKVTSYVYNLVPPASSGGLYRVYVDFREARQAPSLPPRLKNSTPLVRLVKVNQFDSRTVRLVADLSAPHPYAPVFLDDPPRLELLVAEEAALMPPREADAQPPPPKAKSRPERAAARGPADSMARQLGLKIKRVVIDPGHGGKDSGASGFGNLEKDVALKTARLLSGKIKSRLNLEVIMTRDSDKFVTLDRRGRIVKDNKGDLFISIHANSNTLSSVEGLETYVLNFATDPSAMTVAARENASYDKSMSELGGVLDTLAKNTKVAESRVLAKSVHQGALGALRPTYKVRDLGVKEAVFVVLLNTDVPSVLIEIGFLSNKGEALRLADDEYLDLLTDGVVDGLAAYINGLPH
jgi:N-acetylmuramoyl-L-alanine amidase